jgi:hypothetical protein
MTRRLDALVTLAWGALAALHLAPAAVLVMPGLVERLYGVSAQGEAGVLLIHRGALFLALVVLCVGCIVGHGARRAASLAVATSMLGFLAVYAAAGLPAGGLRTIFVADLLGLVPLALVVWAAWRPVQP